MKRNPGAVRPSPDDLHESATPASRINASSELVPTCPPTIGMAAPPRAVTLPPERILNAPTLSDATTCVAPTQVASQDTTAGSNPCSSIWPATIVI